MSDALGFPLTQSTPNPHRSSYSSSRCYWRSRPHYYWSSNHRRTWSHSQRPWSQHWTEPEEGLVLLLRVVRDDSFCEAFVSFFIFYSYCCEISYTLKSCVIAIYGQSQIFDIYLRKLEEYKMVQLILVRSQLKSKYLRVASKITDKVV